MTVTKALTSIISGIGDPGFVQQAATSIRKLSGFERVAVLRHSPKQVSTILYENFRFSHHRQALQTYATVTHQFNPMLRIASATAVRASDYRQAALWIPKPFREWLIPCIDEELGFRTIGWPEGQEELGLYFPSGEGTIEVGLYRELGRHSAPAGTISGLSELLAPLAASFNRHFLLATLEPRHGSRSSAVSDLLSARETEVCQLLVQGCSTGAIALRLSLSAHTVKDHRKSIFRKLAVTSLAELFSLHH